MLAVLHPSSVDRPRGTGSSHSSRSGRSTTSSTSAVDPPPIFARLARLASGHGYGLVLERWWREGFAHLGVLRALREQGIPVDEVAGCSMGTVVAAAMALLGLDGDELMVRAEQQFHRLLDYTLPIVSLVEGARISRNIDETFGTWDIEDLWLPFYCVSTNVTKSRVSSASPGQHGAGDPGERGDPRCLATGAVPG